MPKNGRALVWMMLAAMTIAGCSPKAPASTAQKGPDLVPVQVEHVQKGGLNQEAGIVGKFAPNETAQIAPKVNGKISTIKVQLGQQVKKGDTLFSLDPSDLQIALKQAQAAYQTAQANLIQAQNSSAQGIDQAQSSAAQANSGITQAQNALAQAQQALKDAQDNADRMQQLYSAGAVTKVDLDKAQTGLKSAELAYKNAQATLNSSKTTYANAQRSVNHAQKQSGVDVAKASLAQASVGLENAREQLANSSVKAPLSGMIAEVNGSTGQMAGPQSPVVTIVNIDPILVKANLSEKEVMSVKMGDPVTVEVPAVGKKIEAKVTALSPVMDAQAKAYPVEIAIPNPDKLWKSDMVVNVIFKGAAGSVDDSLIVPNQAVFEEQGKKYVYKVNGDTAKKVEVKTGEETSEQIQIESGLKVDDVIVVKGQTLLHDGAKVKIQ